MTNWLKPNNSFSLELIIIMFLMTLSYESDLCKTVPNIQLSKQKWSFPTQNIEQFKVAKTLIAKGDVANLTKFLDESWTEQFKSDWGETLMRIAAQSGNLSMVTEFIDRGVDVNEKSKNTGSNAFMYACESGQLEIVKFLIKKGARVNDASRSGSTPIIWGYNHLAIVQLLILNGADINVKNLDGNTALFEAVWHRNHEVVEFLLNQKVDLTIKDGQERTILDVSRITGDKKMIRLLQRAMRK